MGGYFRNVADFATFELHLRVIVDAHRRREGTQCAVPPPVHLISRWDVRVNPWHRRGEDRQQAFSERAHLS